MKSRLRGEFVSSKYKYLNIRGNKKNIYQEFLLSKCGSVNIYALLITIGFAEQKDTYTHITYRDNLANTRSLIEVLSV